MTDPLPTEPATVTAPEPAAVHVAPAPAPEPPTLSGHFLLVSIKRAFRLQIDAKEVLGSERRALAEGASHITEPEHQAFLAWRRSVLLVVAVAFVPLTILRFIEAFEGPRLPDSARAVVLLPAFAEALFCAVAFWQLARWTRWASQRRVLFIAWARCFVAPYFVYLYPFQEVFDDSVAHARAAAYLGELRLGATRSKIHLAVGLAFGIKSMLVLAPKAISLMPGLIRASIVTKLLFPGTTAPGYLMMIAAPLYALFAYVIILLPYQITASPYFVAGILGVMAAQVFIAAAGRRLTVPLSQAEAHTRIHKYWLAYVGILVGSAVVMLVGVLDFVLELDFGVVSVISGVLSFAANVLVLTLIGTDAIIANMRRVAERPADDTASQLHRLETEARLRAFCAPGEEPPAPAP